MRAPLKQLLQVTPSDTVTLPFHSLAIYVGVSGDITALDTVKNKVVIKAAPVGWMYDLTLTQIFATGTTATNILIGR
jgi:hypothetical protein